MTNDYFASIQYRLFFPGFFFVPIFLGIVAFIFFLSLNKARGYPLLFSAWLGYASSFLAQFAIYYFRSQ